jgi:hypothetical protein
VVGAGEPVHPLGCGGEQHAVPGLARADRALIARIAASERWGRTGDRSAATAPARHGLRAKFELEADPDGVLPIDERARRADALQRAHMLRLSLASARARRRKT